jgi:transcriptional regulator with XRE-family HTH domain
MARNGLTTQQVAEASGLNLRTVLAILNGESPRPQAKTLHRLAQGLGVDVDELFQNAATLAFRSFDRATNPVVAETIASHPDLYAGWTSADFDELYSRFGTGGSLTIEGTLAATRAMNTKRAVLDKVALLLESNEAALLQGIVDLLYDKIVVTR